MDEPVSRRGAIREAQEASPRSRRAHLRRFLIDLFELSPAQAALFQRLVDASPRVWHFSAELRQVIRATETTL